jgi:hypothetical protein
MFASFLVKKTGHRAEDYVNCSLKIVKTSLALRL